jgi:hypothetical protein
MKKCPFCSEEIQNEAKKCRHCGEYLDKTIAQIINKEDDRFNDFIEFLKQKYPAYSVVSKNYEKNYIILNKPLSGLNPLIFIVLLLLWILPGIIYLLVALSNKKILSLTVQFDQKNKPISVDNPDFNFLVKKYQEIDNQNI